MGNKLFVLTGADRPDQLKPTTNISDPSLKNLSGLSGHDLISYDTGSPANVDTGDLAVKEINNETIGIVQGLGGGAWAYRLSPIFESIRVDSTLKV